MPALALLLSSAILILVGILIASKVSKFYQERKRLTRAISKLPGPPEQQVPLLANAQLVLLYELATFKQFDSFVLLYHDALSTCRLFADSGIYHFYLGNSPIVALFSPENVEPLLTSGINLNKSLFYRVFEPWIGEGLITSRTTKWRVRRKIITPAFHFRILSDFMPIINAEATKLVHKLNNVSYAHEFDLGQVIALCTLDAICETAMGININCQQNGSYNYVRALNNITKFALARVGRPWLWPDAIFYRTKLGKEFVEARDLTRKFTMDVILKRKAEWQQVLDSTKEEQEEQLSKQDSSLAPRSAPSSRSSSSSAIRTLAIENYIESASFKKSRIRLAFLDILLHQHLIEHNLTLDDIREEVETFMFAGQDTTAISISWTLYMLGLHSDIQERVYSELNEIFALEVSVNELKSSRIKPETGADADTTRTINRKLCTADVTSEHLAKMKYLDMVIKESLRMWPSVPFVGRYLTEDLVVGGGKYLIPKGCSCGVFIHGLHNNPKYYPRPEVFDPQRFSPENTLKRHPFAYVPFSGGPRNCIGQKYSMLEMKIILAKVLSNYKIESMIQMDKLRVVGELVLKSTTGWPVKLLPRY